MVLYMLFKITSGKLWVVCWFVGFFLGGGGGGFSFILNFSLMLRMSYQSQAFLITIVHQPSGICRFYSVIFAYLGQAL